MKRAREVAAATAPEIVTQGFAYRTAFAQGSQGEQPGAFTLNVEIQAPGGFVTEQPSVRIVLEQRRGPGSQRHTQHDTLDVYVADLDRLVATLQKAIEVARATGVLEATV